MLSKKFVTIAFFALLVPSVMYGFQKEIDRYWQDKEAEVADIIQSGKEKLLGSGVHAILVDVSNDPLLLKVSNALHKGLSFNLKAIHHAGRILKNLEDSFHGTSDKWQEIFDREYSELKSMKSVDSGVMSALTAEIDTEYKKQLGKRTSRSCKKNGTCNQQ